MNICNYLLINYLLLKLKMQYLKLIGDWGLGIGDWGLGIGPNPQSPIPIPNPHPHEVINFKYCIFNFNINN